MDHTITLPNSKGEISFRSPKVKDKRDAIRDFSQDSSARNKGYNLEEAIAAACLTGIGGESVNLENDLMSEPYDLMNDWEFIDQQYYLEVFSNLYFLDEKGKQKAAEAAKKIIAA